MAVAETMPALRPYGWRGPLVAPGASVRAPDWTVPMRTLTSLLLILALAAPAAAQEREIRDANLPRLLETRLLRMYDGDATRHDGPTVIETGRVVAGDLAVLGGPLRVAGTVDGDVAVVSGDVVMEPGGVVTGSITVVGGEVRMADDARVGGTITAYGAPSSDWRRDRVAADDRTVRDRRVRTGRGDSRLMVRAGTSYNRVEGLPIMVGPVIETAGSTPLRLEASAIWRTETGASLDTDRMGYRVRAEQFMTADRSLSAGATVHSVVDPMDRWQLSDLEASLAAFLFHHDYRDHFERVGWSAFVRARPVAGLDARLTYRDERHAALPAGDPWALFNRSDSWRLQPMIAEGTLRTIGADVELDRRAYRDDGPYDRRWRDRRDEPVAGWLARLSVERPVGGALEAPALGDIPAARVDTDFTTAFVDLRQYNPVGRASTLSFRLAGGGSLDGGALPPQLQHALGGPGTLPGYELFHADCGAREVTGVRDDHAFYRSYGCDRFVLGQVEYRGGLSLGFGWGHDRNGHHRDDPKNDTWHDWWDDVRIDLSPTWVVFMDAGRGWGVDDRSTDTLVDAGLGFLVGRLGFYAAVPITGDVDQKPRFHLRWGSRF
jgi:hypothetical protein